MAKERIIWLDNLKAILIMIVVLGHTILFTNHDGTGNVAYRIISSFWMPLFMFTSGFSSYRAVLDCKLIKRRFFQLMIPFTIWSAILCAINGTYHIEQMFLYPTQSVWFIFALFFITIIHVLTAQISARLKMKEEIVVCIVAFSLWVIQRLTKIDYFCFGLICFHFVFYSLGFYARKYFIKVISLKPVYYYVMAIAFLVMAYFRHDSYLSVIHLPSSVYILYDSLCAFMSLAPFVYFFSKYANKSLIITKMGGGTLGIYVFHIAVYTLLIRIAGDLCIKSESMLYYTLYVLILWQFVFWISYLLTILTDKTKYLSIMLLGKKCS